MLNEDLSSAIKNSTQRSVFACYRNEAHCTEFDSRLSALSIQLREVCPNIHFDSNGSSERYEIIFPEKMSTELSELIAKLLTETPLSIEKTWGFGALA